MNRQEIEHEVTERILEALEAGTVPWHQPWSAAGILPTSAQTGKPYRGMNVWLLSLTAEHEGYGNPYWLTYKQARARGGHVRKGEHGTRVLFWKRLEVADNEGAPGDTKTIPMMRTYTVFNLEQCEGVELPPRMALRLAEDRPPVDPGDELRDIMAGYVNGPQVRHVRGDSAYYRRDVDTITLPELSQFADAPGYAATALHELTHSTGHPSRLDRPQHGHFGDERYAQEELVAEMGAAMLAATHGIAVSFDNSAAYVANWLQALRNDHGLVIAAAQKAQKACDRILGTTFPAEVPSEVAVGA